MIGLIDDTHTIVSHLFYTKTIYSIWFILD